MLDKSIVKLMVDKLIVELMLDKSILKLIDNNTTSNKLRGRK
jgi:hypothetical protein